MNSTPNNSQNLKEFAPGVRKRLQPANMARHIRSGSPQKNDFDEVALSRKQDQPDHEEVATLHVPPTRKRVSNFVRPAGESNLLANKNFELMNQSRGNKSARQTKGKSSKDKQQKSADTNAKERKPRKPYVKKAKTSERKPNQTKMKPALPRPGSHDSNKQKTSLGEQLSDNDSSDSLSSIEEKPPLPVQHEATNSKDLESLIGEVKSSLPNSGKEFTFEELLKVDDKLDASCGPAKENIVDTFTEKHCSADLAALKQAKPLKSTKNDCVKSKTKLSEYDSKARFEKKTSTEIIASNSLFSPTWSTQTAVSCGTTEQTSMSKDKHASILNEADIAEGIDTLYSPHEHSLSKEKTVRPSSRSRPKTSTREPAKNDKNQLSMQLDENAENCAAKLFNKEPDNIVQNSTSLKETSRSPSTHNKQTRPSKSTERHAKSRSDTSLQKQVANSSSQEHSHRDNKFRNPASPTRAQSEINIALKDNERSQSEILKFKEMRPSIQTDKSVREYAANEEQSWTNDRFRGPFPSPRPQKYEHSGPLHSNSDVKLTSAHKGSSTPRSICKSSSIEERSLTDRKSDVKPKIEARRPSVSVERRTSKQNDARFIEENATNSGLASFSQVKHLSSNKPTTPCPAQELISSACSSSKGVVHHESKHSDKKSKAYSIFDEPSKYDMVPNAFPKPFSHTPDYRRSKKQVADSSTSSVEPLKPVEHKISSQDRQSLHFEKKANVSSCFQAPNIEASYDPKSFDSKSLSQSKRSHSSIHNDRIYKQHKRDAVAAKYKSTDNEGRDSTSRNHVMNNRYVEQSNSKSCTESLQNYHMTANQENPVDSLRYEEQQHREIQLINSTEDPSTLEIKFDSKSSMKPLEAENKPFIRSMENSVERSMYYQGNSSKSMKKYSKKFITDNSIEEKGSTSVTQAKKPVYSSNNDIINRTPTDLFHEVPSADRIHNLSHQHRKTNSKAHKKKSSSKTDEDTKYKYETSSQRVTEHHKSRRHRRAESELKQSSTIVDARLIEKGNGTEMGAFTPLSHGLSHYSEKNRTKNEQILSRNDDKTSKQRRDSLVKSLPFNELNKSTPFRQSDQSKNIAMENTQLGPSNQKHFNSEKLKTTKHEHQPQVRNGSMDKHHFQIDQTSKSAVENTKIDKHRSTDNESYKSAMLAKEALESSSTCHKPIVTEDVPLCKDACLENRTHNECDQTLCSQENQANTSKSKKRRHSRQSEKHSKKHSKRNSATDNGTKNHKNLTSSKPIEAFTRNDIGSVKDSKPESIFKKPTEVSTNDKQPDNCLVERTQSVKHKKSSHKSRSSKEKRHSKSDKHANIAKEADIALQATLAASANEFSSTKTKRSETSKSTKRKSSTELDLELENQNVVAATENVPKTNHESVATSSPQPEKRKDKHSKHKKRRHSKRSSESLTAENPDMLPEESLIPDAEFHSLFDDMVLRSNCFFDCTDGLTTELDNELDMTIYHCADEPLLTDQEFHSLFDDMVARTEHFIKNTQSLTS